ncbi:receptor-like kinase LIP1 [Lycium ferocissimum]|uniref:receptor-like kinase LIP1 n=1 Tax=Lycium ferocissimum TaxID=112874 RepID=UPI00281680D1|nr:receptor-like kinase LIP1 [Lycium ferocissimum]XP_059276311.1 receptor-like kinase LIP1 [Lycium ferocissimum]
MDQFRQIGEVVGSLKALMVLKHDIQINQKQCCLLFDMYVQAFDTISEGIKHNLRLNERNNKWQALAYPMRELHRIFKEGEMYIKSCMDVKDLWGKAISLHLNKDCVEFHVHNLLCCFPVVIEAIETAAEISGFDEEDMQKRRTALAKKYEGEVMCDPRFFQWMFGKQYLVTREICSELESCWKEDKWYLLEMIRQNLAIKEHRLAEILLKKLNGSEEFKQIMLLPSLILVGASDYHVKRRLGSRGGHVKEINWLGESFALRNFFGELNEPLLDELFLLFSLSHPNVLQYHCGFYDEERKEGYLVMELMNKSLAAYIKEHSSQRKKGPFSVQVAVDIMLQIARGMEYLHSKKIYHGELNPSNVLLKPRNSSAESSYFHAKVKGTGSTSINSNHNADESFIWYAPEVLTEKEKPESICAHKYTEKADVYSYGMICFQLLTGKAPFDEHLQGEKMARNIRTGERPLFPYPSPKYLANLTRKCWQTNPNLRPSFSSLCRILHYIKKILVINPEHGQPECPPPLVDYCEIEAGYSKKFSGEDSSGLAPVSQIPFQMFAYRLVENEKISGNSKDKHWDSSHYGFSGSMQSDDERMAAIDDLFFDPSDRRSVCSEIIERKDSRFWDQRSAISETPLRKDFSFDQMSVGSESPKEKFSAANEKTIYADIPESKIILTPGKTFSSIRKNQKLKFLENQENVTMSPKTDDKKPSSSVEAEKKMASPGNSDEKNSSGDQMLVSSATLEEKNSSDNQKLKDSESPEKKQSSTSNVKSIRGDSTQRKALSRRTKSKNPDKKVLSSPEATENSISSENPEITASKPSNSKVSVKRTPLHKKLQDKESSTTPEKLTDPSPRSSPARVKRVQSSTMSSPTRTPKPFTVPRSPAITSNGNLYQSPSASPLNPCARCANRDVYLPSGMSPHRPRKPHSISNSQCVHNS